MRLGLAQDGIKQCRFLSHALVVQFLLIVGRSMRLFLLPLL
jgi:hypothetical protein